ncbi:MAG: hypothetical protein K9M49_06990 [Candidatus Marinimicrobia bacterium]|nr:hypothetical protein [Candidatus Neomarinimicrobiota bacterium]MCF7851273.1 hypothetical protein [Candidatus Neomarinimicrobiota bacterium]MCF7904885.1 hypothetical protein [Candidatus Neomarinimicrobiota bacterium]
MIGILLLICAQMIMASDFPVINDQDSFESDLHSAALINQLPNLKGGDHYLGLKISTLAINSPNGQFVPVPEVRLSIYPNPGYNMWANFAKWPGDSPTFSYGTGVQVAFYGENVQSEQAIGFTWSMITGEWYQQRDIKIHGMFSRVLDKWEYGLIALLDLHHVIAEKNLGVNSYDGTIMQIAPYIKLMNWDAYNLSLMVPLSKDGGAISLSLEHFLGKRD